MSGVGRWGHGASAGARREGAITASINSRKSIWARIMGGAERRVEENFTDAGTSGERRMRPDEGEEKEAAAVPIQGWNDLKLVRRPRSR